MKVAIFVTLLLTFFKIEVLPKNVTFNNGYSFETKDLTLNIVKPAKMLEASLPSNIYYVIL